MLQEVMAFEFIVRADSVTVHYHRVKNDLKV